MKGLESSRQGGALLTSASGTAAAAAAAAEEEPPPSSSTTTTTNAVLVRRAGVGLALGGLWLLSWALAWVQHHATTAQRAACLPACSEGIRIFMN
eukprot:COSAG01_NODE_2654_length_7306_cov_60.980991_4_plen_95_part_00